MDDFPARTPGVSWRYPQGGAYLANGVRVLVIDGQFGGYRGTVVNRRPDLRPGSVWVALDGLGARLIPAYRLAPLTESTGQPPELAGPVPAPPDQSH